jgi:hypothetical protein
MANIDGFDNTITGYYALAANTSGNSNTAYGVFALRLNTTGYNNTACGMEALRSNTAGYENTACGIYALNSNTTGSNNTGIGRTADVSSGNLVNATVIGNLTSVDASNKVRIGNTSVTSNGGQVSWTAYSDGRYKNDVQEDVPGLAFIEKLRPITYYWDIHKMNDAIYGKGKDTTMWDGKYDIENMKWTGFIAQDVEKAAQECNYDFSGIDKSGNIMGLRYAEFVVPLVKGMQEQQEQIKELKAENDSLKAEIEEMKEMLNRLNAKIEK